MRWLTFLIVIILSLILLKIDAKPTLDEEKRNLCEGESDIAECIKEIEEAKSSPSTIPSDTEKTDDNKENKKEDDESEGQDPYEMMLEHREKIRKMVAEDDQNRAYWDEEYKSMNKWARYGIA